MNNNHQLQSVLPDFLAALQDIPQHEKLEYLQALRVARHLFETESDPLAFLRFCDWNVTAAARRLTVYWRLRKEVFGETRAFLPLLNDFSGNGALASDEIELLRSGAYCRLPNDTHGRPVAYADNTRPPVKLQNRADVRLRTVFYVLQHVAMNPLSQSMGVVFLVRGLQKTERNNVAKKGNDILHHALPVRVNAMHFAYVRQEGNGFRQSVVPFLMAHFGRFFSQKLITHSVDSVEHFVANMAKYGVSRESLPDCLGGWARTDGTASYPSEPLPRCGPISRDVVAGYDQQLQPDLDLGPLAGATPTVNNRIHGLDAADLKLDSRRNDRTRSELDSSPFGLEDIQLLDPKPIQSQPREQLPPLGSPVPQVASNDILFSEMLEKVPIDLEGSPFEPRPFRSRQHHVAGDAVLLDSEVPAIGGFGTEDSASSPRPTRLSLQQKQDAALSTGHTSANEDAPLRDSDLPLVNVVETPGMLERGLIALNEAMNGLPVDEHSAYEDAVGRAPKVVKTESNPLTYLRFEKFNAWAAAQRLSLYWKYRVKHFGDTAFLPLTQTTGGALSEEDLRTLSAGSFFLLPPDSRGRPMLCFDPSKRPKDVSENSLRRVAIYFFSIICCEYPVTVTEGCIILVFVSSLNTEMSDADESTRKAIDAALDSFPIRNCETHVIFSPSPMASPLRSFTVLVLPLLLRALGKLLTEDRVHFHIGDTRDELERKLSLCGLSRAGLQAAVGGGICDRDFATWMKDRQLLELQRHAHGQQKVPPLPPSVFAHGAAKTTTDHSEGSSDPNRNSAADPLDKINSAMALVSPSEKKDYLQAFRKVPDLVRKESDPVRFLKLENYNSFATARRLAAYWRIRCEVFSDRAFFPMNQTSEGALNRMDFAVLQTGFLTQLPNDTGGCSVISYDGSRLEKSSSPSSKRRLFFYLLSVLSHNDLSQTGGYSVLFNMSEEPSLDQDCIEYFNLAMEAHPVKLKCFHLLGCWPDSKSESSFRQGPVRDMESRLDRLVQEKMVVHICGSRGGFAAKLGHHGISRGGLPKALGGEWGFEDFVLWQELQARHEWGLPIRTSAHLVAKKYGIPTSTGQRDLPRLHDEEKAERKRRLNVIHSRKLRNRKRIQVQAFQ